MPVVTIERKVLEKNDGYAARNREALRRNDVFSFNLVSSPGSGKTSLLEKTLGQLAGKLKVAVIEGDIQTDIDAQRVAKFGVPAIQIVTNGGCHLDAQLVNEAMSRLDLSALDLLIIENVGNLVCPANFDLGEAIKVVVVSVTEGEEKPLKYPAMFHRASVLIINKIDLAPYVSCKVQDLKENALRINPLLTVFETSCTTEVGLADWTNWLIFQSLNFRVDPDKRSELLTELRPC